MGEEKKETGRTRIGLDLSSKFWKTFMLLVAAFLVFAGPTYVAYVLQRRPLYLSYGVSMLSGFVLFFVGLGLIWYLLKSKVIS